MPRIPRGLSDGLVYHVLNRGNGKQRVFHSDKDYEAFVSLMREAKERYSLKLLAYCLMPNHFHIVLMPAQSEDLSKWMQWLMTSHVRRYHRYHGTSGHVWQGRFFSSPLDEAYLWAAMRYVERNPVRAKMVRKAENYRWSSAAAHCRVREDEVLTKKPIWRKQFEAIGDWSAWLAEGDAPEQLEIMRRHTEKGLPCGSEKFIRKLETLVGRALHYRPQGRPRKDDRKKG